MLEGIKRRLGLLNLELFGGFPCRGSIGKLRMEVLRRARASASSISFIKLSGFSAAIDSDQKKQ
jgi:hypothetical protein